MTWLKMDGSGNCQRSEKGVIACGVSPVAVFFVYFENAGNEKIKFNGLKIVFIWRDIEMQLESINLVQAWGFPRPGGALLLLLLALAN